MLGGAIFNPLTGGANWDPRLQSAWGRHLPRFFGVVPRWFSPVSRKLSAGRRGRGRSLVCVFSRGVERGPSPAARKRPPVAASAARPRGRGRSATASPRDAGRSARSADPKRAPLQNGSEGASPPFELMRGARPDAAREEPRASASRARTRAISAGRHLSLPGDFRRAVLNTSATA